MIRTCYVAFPTQGTPPVTAAARLSLPAGDGLGAVVICHGSDGVDGRGEFYAPILHGVGLATLELDVWAARGSTRGAAARPRSPIETVPDAFAALRFLGGQPEIDPARIGIMGFSWGGVVTLLAATRRLADLLRGDAPSFAAHAPLYPVCWAYGAVPALALDELTGAPILLQTGGADAYDAPDDAPALAASLRKAGATEVSLIVHPGASHGFDRDLPAQTINDPFAHRGAGGPVEMAFDPTAAAASRRAITAFFARTLA
ncbi:MAG TPA: dienelactone hydrolase family protein [Caulobacteraceae bacterium]|nr:dienelactone hydrolase family protein [Caulobacteraceae bacterium]